MRLQLSFEMTCTVKYVGTLALVGTATEPRKEGGQSTIATFLLAFSENAELAHYMHPHGGLNPSTSLLFSIFIGEGLRCVRSCTDNSQCFLVFNREVKGELRDARKFLHATANLLLSELQAIEDEELVMLETDDQLDWADRHSVCDCKMPDFKRPRHS